MTTVSVQVWADIDLGEIEDDDLIEELGTRDLGAIQIPLVDDDIEEMFYAFKLGRDDRAMELAKIIAQKATGRIL